jgi:predicted TIM-barrel fold metal-dependent hydrolase
MDFMNLPFDSHCHLLPGEVYKNASFYNESWGDMRGHIERMDEEGVGWALLSYPTTDYHIRTGIPEIRAAMVYNDAVKKLCDESGGRLKFLATIPVGAPGEMREELRRAIKAESYGITMPTNGGGVYPDDERYLPFFEDVEKTGMPVFFHPTTLTPFGHGSLRHPLITPVFQYAFDTSICMAKVVESGLLMKFPRLKLVFASFGGTMPFLAGRFDRTYRMLKDRGIVRDMGADPGESLKKFYVDTSGVTSRALLMLALEVFGEDKVMWGSDYPANRDIKASIETIKSLDISANAKEKILRKNLERLTG